MPYFSLNFYLNPLAGASQLSVLSSPNSKGSPWSPLTNYPLFSWSELPWGSRQPAGGQPQAKSTLQLLLYTLQHPRRGACGFGFTVLLAMSGSLPLHSIHECMATWNHVCVPLEQLPGTSLVVHWIRTHLPVQGTWVPSLVWEDSTFCGASKPMDHNY